MASDTRYILHVLRAQGLIWQSKLHSSEPKIYVSATLGGTKKVTPTIEGNLSPEWNASLTFSASDTSCVFKIQVKHKSAWPSDPCIGYVEIELGKLLRDCESGEAVLDLLVPHKKSSGSRATAGTICLELKTVDLLSSAETDVNNLQQTVDSSGIGNAGNFTTLSRVDGVSRLADGNDLYKSIGGLLSKLDIIAKFIDDVSEVHPYLKVAWDLTSVVYKSVANVFKVDKKAVDLARALDETFDFTTCDYCEFLEKYMPRGFVGRMLSLDASATIDKFMQSVREQKNDLNLGLAIHNVAITARTSQKIDELLLQNRFYMHNAVPPARKPCLEGTRVKDRRDIIGLLRSETSPSIVWLHGVAGSGKSTIATSIEDYFRDVSQLGAFLKFERGKSDPSSVVRELAFKLALFDSSIGSRITQQVEQDKDIASALLSRRFKKLLLEPLCAAAAEPVVPSAHGTVVIVLDALDECGTPGTRADLMCLLKDEFPTLPRNFRFLVTSRPEPDIMRALSRSESVRQIELDYRSDVSRHNVLSYLHNEMRKITSGDPEVEVPEGWPWDENLAVLGEAADGLFIWASTAVKLVAMSDNPFRKLKNLVSDSRLPSKHGLDDLYATVLRDSGISWDEDDSKTRFSAVLGLLLFSKIPLSKEDIDGFLGFPPEESSGLILSRLRCVLSYSPGEPVRLFHASFSDYLQSPGRATEPWFINMPKEKTDLAMRCFAVMKVFLHFNMGDLETSFVRNDKIQGLDDRIKVNIPLHLEYACAYWAQHLVEIAISPCLLDALSDFAYRRLLFWFEVLSLLKIFRRITSRALPDVVSWAACNTTVTSFLKDASSLATVFADPISQSTPHIYISMLPLTRQDSEVSAHYSQWMSSMVSVEEKGVKPKPMWLKVLEGHSEKVTTVCFSPDGRRIVSGSSDGTVRMWNTDSGEFVCAPLEGHERGVFSFAVSTDGQYMSSVSYSGTIRTWDMKDGASISCLLAGSTGNVRAFSSDGRYLVTVSSDDKWHLWDVKGGNAILLPYERDKDSNTTIAVSPTGMIAVAVVNDVTVRLWDIENGMAASELLAGNSVSSVSRITFSPDGAHIALGYYNGEIKIWNVASGKVASGPFVGHTSWVECVAFSPDGLRVVSSSDDGTIIIWDAIEGEAVAGPFIGHSSSVNSVAFSPDGSRIVSGSDDRTVRVWEVSSVSNFTTSSNENTSRITIVAFSPDDSKIASVSEDGDETSTIRVWDVGGDPGLSRCFEEHDTAILSLAFTPDGSYIISGSEDGTIRVWKLSTGTVVSGSYEAHVAGIISVSVSPNGMCIISASSVNSVRIWDWTTGAVDVVSGPFLGDAERIFSVVLSPDASRVVYGTGYGKLILWDIRSGNVILRPLQGHECEVTSVVYSPDGRHLASCDDYEIRVWNATTGDLISGPFGKYVRSIAFSPDGSKIVLGSYRGTVSLWDVMTGQRTADALEGHRDSINSVAFSHDGRHVASGSDDGTIRLWDVEGALSAYGSPDEEDTTNWKMTSDGWIVSRKKELLLWMPPDRRRDVLDHRNMTMFGCAFWTKIDFRNANIGSRWRDCFKSA